MIRLFLLAALLLQGCAPGCGNPLEADSEAGGFPWARRNGRPADMAAAGDMASSIAIVGSPTTGTFDAQTSLSAVRTGVVAGHTLVFVNSTTCDANGAAGWSAPTESQTWTALSVPTCVAAAGPVGAVTAIWYLCNANAGTHTLANSMSGGNVWGNWAILEFSGMACTVDAVTTSNGGAGAISTTTTGSTQTTSATAIANEVVFVGLAMNTSGAGLANAAITHPPTGYASVMVQNDTSNHEGAEIAYKITSATGTQAATWTWTLNAQTVWQATIGAMK